MSNDKNLEKLDALICREMTLGRLPELTSKEDAIIIAWKPHGPRVRISPYYVGLAYDAILFYVADYPFSFSDAIRATRKFASVAFDLGINVDWILDHRHLKEFR